MEKKHFFVSFKPPRPGTELRTLVWEAAVLTTTLGPTPISICNDFVIVFVKVDYKLLFAYTVLVLDVISYLGRETS